MGPISRRVIRNTVSIVSVALFLVLTVGGQGNRQLYLVTGVVGTNFSPLSVPSTLVAIDETKPAATKLLYMGGGTLVYRRPRFDDWWSSETCVTA